MSTPPLLSVVLAAGKGTRMKSRLPKVLHRIAGLSLVGHVLRTVQSAGGGRIAVVVGPDMDAVDAEARKWAPGAEVFVQAAQAGTADAVLAAKGALGSHAGDVLILFGDTPLVEPATIDRMRAVLDLGAGVVVLGFSPADPAGYGRLVTGPDGALLAIREDKDASPDERRIGLCNSGLMAFRLPNLMAVLGAIGNANAKGEYYLTDAVAIARQQGARVAYVECAADEVLGINTREQLAAAEAVWQRRARARAMAGGATMIAPETVWLSYDTVLGEDVVIEPNVFFAAGVTVENGAEIKANCHFESARIGTGARVGPFARLRPGADLGPHVHIGNFVEVKNLTMGEGAKANHLAYLGDGQVGAGANIGAGTIFCNYDGFNKNKTVVGDGAFIGSNSALVAPVRIGKGAYVAAGSVITKNVADNALAIERSTQEVREGWAEKFRAMMARQKAAKSK
ncbi:MAG: bifunctional UDP-N-acetylglucosamine diphosphorylase/glucosamine-1-phosphate N-acetyltransferase GlmU [Hyphomicrobiaceae bacterium]